MKEKTNTHTHTHTQAPAILEKGGANGRMVWDAA